jgi:transcriptional regulator with XRE-family HTH domain
MPPLRRLRLLRGWSLRDLARESGVAANTILDLEHRARVARPATMRKLAAALGVEIGDVDEFANGITGSTGSTGTGAGRGLEGADRAGDPLEE